VNELATITLAWRDGVCIVSIQGEIDLSNAAEFAAALNDAAAAAESLVVDLSDVTYIDSSGIAELFGLAEQWEDGSSLRVVVPESSPSRRVLNIARLNRTIQLDSDLAQALESVERGVGVDD
jgi:anti-sigma B factor antagonist